MFPLVGRPTRIGDFNEDFPDNFPNVRRNTYTVYFKNVKPIKSIHTKMRNVKHAIFKITNKNDCIFILLLN